jgi:predicted NBD/HSP70 family sugar kinase
MARLAPEWLREILRTLYQNRTVTRAEIIEATKLNPASVSHGLKALLQAGTILKVGELESNGGRRREVLNLNAEAAYFLAVDLEGTRMQFGLTNLVGDIRYRWSSDIDLSQSLPVESVLDGIQAVLKNLDAAQRSQLLAVGVSHPGFADSEGRVTAVNLNWSDFPLRAALERAFDLPVFMEDAHRTCILAERWLGAAKGSRNCMYVIVGNGVGVGVFADGRLLEGRDGIAGELGHVVLDSAATDPCRCGRTGCLEAVVSCPNIVRQYLEKIGASPERLAAYKVTEVFDRARQGDSSALAVVERVASRLGLAFSCLVNLFNPEIIVIGGDVVYGEDLILPRLRTELERRSLPRALAGVQLKVSSLGLDIGLKGAAALAFRQSLLNPVLLKKICSPMAAVRLHGGARKRKRGRRSVRGAR